MASSRLGYKINAGAKQAGASPCPTITVCEQSKKLTIVCEYGTYGDGTVRLKEEYNTGFWSEEFTLE